MFFTYYLSHQKNEYNSRYLIENQLENIKVIWSKFNKKYLKNEDKRINEKKMIIRKIF
jgi:hypothetical protein